MEEDEEGQLGSHSPEEDPLGFRLCLVNGDAFEDAREAVAIFSESCNYMSDYIMNDVPMTEEKTIVKGNIFLIPISSFR